MHSYYTKFVFFLSDKERLAFHFSLSGIGEANGYPLLENPRDGGAWWAAVYGVAQSWTGLKRLSSSSDAKVGSQETPGITGKFGL